MTPRDPHTSSDTARKTNGLDLDDVDGLLAMLAPADPPDDLAERAFARAIATPQLKPRPFWQRLLAPLVGDLGGADVDGWSERWSERWTELWATARFGAVGAAGLAVAAVVVLVTVPAESSVGGTTVGDGVSSLAVADTALGATSSDAWVSAVLPYGLHSSADGDASEVQ